MSCENCTRGDVLPGEPKGTMIGDAYFHPAPPHITETSASKKAIVLFTDIYGIPLVNNRIIADKISEQVGVDVWVPNLFDGSPPITPDELFPLQPKKPGLTMSWINKLKFIWLILTHLPGMIRCRQGVVDPRAIAFVENLKTERHYDKIGAVGYCFGGAIVIRLSSKSLFDTIVVAHPAPCTIDEIKAINVPASWACAEEDSSFITSLRNEAEAVFAARKDTPAYIDYEFKDYEGTVHGFAARPALEIPEAVAGHEAALEQAVAWFKKTLDD